MSTNSPKICRAGQRCEVTSDAEAFDCLCHHSTKKLRQIAQEIGVSENYLRSASSLYDDTHQFQARLIVPITLATGNFVLLDHFERSVGRVAITLPTVALDDESDLFTPMAEIAQEVGHVAAEIQAAFRDHQLAPEEMDRIEREIHHAHEALARMEALLRKQLETERSRELRRVS
jgi:hypothetical protein